MSNLSPLGPACPNPIASAPVRRRAAAVAAGAISALATAAILAPPAGAAVEHTVVSGETLSSIAVANGLDASTLASWNGIPADTYVVEGQALQIPTSDEAAAAGLTTTTATAASTTTASTDPTAVAPSEPVAPAPASWLAPVQTLEGTAYLDAGVATAWEQMRGDALANYGVDLMPAGTLSAYRSPDQQSYLYDLFVQGIGAPANPPGSSAHERGVAVDVASEDMAAVVREIGPNYGFVQTTEEWWHFEWTG